MTLLQNPYFRTSAFLFVVRSYDQKCEKDKLELLACTKKMSWGPSFNKPKVPKIVHLKSISKNTHFSCVLRPLFSIRICSVEGQFPNYRACFCRPWNFRLAEEVIGWDGGSAFWGEFIFWSRINTQGPCSTWNSQKWDYINPLD